jgi:hypothetical protein
MLRCVQSPRYNVLTKYASARRFFARLASESFLSSLRSAFFIKMLDSARLKKLHMRHALKRLIANKKDIQHRDAENAE